MTQIGYVELWGRLYFSHIKQSRYVELYENGFPAWIVFVKKGFTMRHYKRRAANSINETIRTANQGGD